MRDAAYKVPSPGQTVALATATFQWRADADIMARSPDLLAMLLLTVSELHGDDMEEHTLEVMRDAHKLIADIECGVDGPPVHELRAERVQNALQVSLKYIDRDIRLSASAASARAIR
jgi:hypothetical protein